MVDIVDEDLNYIKTITKKESHEKGLLQCTVIGQVVNSEGEFLLVKQAKHKQDQGIFVTPMGGHVLSNESFEDAMKREMEEELGMKDFTFEYVGKFIFNRPVKKHIENHYFIVYLIHSDEEVILNDESVEYMWMTLEDLKKDIKENPTKYGPSLKAVFEKLFFKDEKIKTIVFDLDGVLIQEHCYASKLFEKKFKIPHEEFWGILKKSNFLVRTNDQEPIFNLFEDLFRKYNIQITEEEFDKMLENIL